MTRCGMWQHSTENKRQRHAVDAAEVPPGAVAARIGVPVAQVPTNQRETPTFDGLEGAELVRAVCAWLMATAPKTGKDADSRLEVGEERVARLAHTVAAAGLAVGNGETEQYVDDFCAFLQARYFDGITTDEHGAEARSRAREHNRLIERLCSEQKFEELANSLPLPVHDREASVVSDLEEVGPVQQEEAEKTQAWEELNDLEDVEALEELEESAEEDEMEDEHGDADEEQEEEAATDDEEPDEMATDELENQLDLTAGECEEQDRARLMRHWQQRLEQQREQQRQRQTKARLLAALWDRQQQQESGEAEAFARQQQRRRSDPFSAYNLVTPRQRHEPRFSSLSNSPLGGWAPQPRRRRVARPWTTSGFGHLVSPMTLF